MRLPAVFSLLPLLAAGCQTQPPASPAAQPAQSPPVIAANAAGTTELAIGQLLRIELEGNPSTGYRWDVDGELPPQLEAADGLPDGPAATTTGAPPRVGAPKTQWLHFRAVKPGPAELHLRWHRPWEGDAAPARTARYPINVR